MLPSRGAFRLFRDDTRFLFVSVPLRDPELLTVNRVPLSCQTAETARVRRSLVLSTQPDLLRARLLEERTELQLSIKVIRSAVGMDWPLAISLHLSAGTKKRTCSLRRYPAPFRPVAGAYDRNKAHGPAGRGTPHASGKNKLTVVSPQSSCVRAAGRVHLGTVNECLRR